MKNTVKLRFIACEQKVIQKGDRKGEVYHQAKFIDDESNQVMTFFITSDDDMKIVEDLMKLEKYSEHLCDIDTTRTRYGFDCKLISVA